MVESLPLRGSHLAADRLAYSQMIVAVHIYLPPDFRQHACGNNDFEQHYYIAHDEKAKSQYYLVSFTSQYPKVMTTLSSCLVSRRQPQLLRMSVSVK